MPSHRRQGLARKLKIRFEEWARAQGAKVIVTQVHTRNTGMLALNRSLGYEDSYLEQRKSLA